MARRGGLIGYGVLFQVLFANAATYVDRILKVARAGDLPIEQASRFETVVNLKTADALALTLPRAARRRRSRGITSPGLALT